MPGWLFAKSIRVKVLPLGGYRDYFTGNIDGVAIHAYPKAENLGAASRLMTQFTAVVGRKMPLWITETGQHLSRYDVPPPLGPDSEKFSGPPYTPVNARPLSQRPLDIVATLHSMLKNPYANIRGAMIWDAELCNKAGLFSAYHQTASPEACQYLPLPATSSGTDLQVLPEAKILGVYGP